MRLLHPCTRGAARIVLGGRFGEEPLRISWARLDAFAAAGGRLVDTAHSYAGGRSEEVIGRWLNDNPAVLGVVDKIGHPGADGALDLSAGALRREVERSCRRLGVDTLDVLLLHRDDPSLPVAEVAGTLLELANAGRARLVGVSNWPAPRLAELVPRLMRDGVVPVVSYQYSLAVPERPLWTGALHADDEVLEVVDRHRLPLLAWAAQARGFFTGVTDLPDAAGPDPFGSPRNTARRRRCRRLAERTGQGTETIALAWTLHHDQIWPVVGPRTVAELHASLAAATVRLDARTLAWLSNGGHA